MVFQLRTLNECVPEVLMLFDVFLVDDANSLSHHSLLHFLGKLDPLENEMGVVWFQN